MQPQFDDLTQTKDPRRFLHINITQKMRRYPYHDLPPARYTAPPARPARGSHTRDYNAIPELAPNNLKQT